LDRGRDTEGQEEGEGHRRTGTEVGIQTDRDRNTDGQFIPVQCQKCLKIKKHILHNTFLTVQEKKNEYEEKFLEYYDESVVKFSVQSELFSAYVVKGLTSDL
jgi:hypothetical protein